MTTEKELRDAHFRYSVLRERIVEHLFVGQIMQALWKRGVYDIEVLRAEFDTGGYDLVLTRSGQARYIQFKVSLEDARRRDVNVNMRLASVPSGCVVWIGVSHNLDFQWFRWFGNGPGEKLSDLSAYPKAKHTRGNAQGIKGVRADQRLVPKSDFVKIASLEDVLVRLFGDV